MFFLKCPVPSQENGHCYIIYCSFLCVLHFNVVFLLCRCYPLIFDAFPSVLVCNPDFFFQSIYEFRTAVYYCCIIFELHCSFSYCEYSRSVLCVLRLFVPFVNLTKFFFLCCTVTSFSQLRRGACFQWEQSFSQIRRREYFQRYNHFPFPSTALLTAQSIKLLFNLYFLSQSFFFMKGWIIICYVSKFAILIVISITEFGIIDYPCYEVTF